MKLVFFKAHVRGHTRTNKATGKQSEVREHDDKRSGAAPYRLATIHTAGPETPGHTVRMAQHPEKPGVWRIHPEDRERIRGILGGKKLSHSLGHHAFLALGKKDREAYASVIKRLRASGDRDLQEFAAGWETAASKVSDASSAEIVDQARKKGAKAA